MSGRKVGSAPTARVTTCRSRATACLRGRNHTGVHPTLDDAVVLGDGGQFNIAIAVDPRVADMADVGPRAVHDRSDQRGRHAPVRGDGAGLARIPVRWRSSKARRRCCPLNGSLGGGNASQVFDGRFDGDLGRHTARPGHGHTVRDEGETQVFAQGEGVLVFMANPPRIRPAGTARMGSSVARARTTQDLPTPNVLSATFGQHRVFTV